MRTEHTPKMVPFYVFLIQRKNDQTKNVMSNNKLILNI